MEDCTPQYEFSSGEHKVCNTYLYWTFILPGQYSNQDSCKLKFHPMTTLNEQSMHITFHTFGSQGEVRRDFSPLYLSKR